MFDGPLSPIGMNNKTVLIAEDDLISALLLRKILESKGYKVDHVKNGRDALDLFQKKGHKILITDWMMPEMDGIELCKHIRRDSLSYVYIILLTASSQKEVRSEAFEAGIDDFITKPLDKDDLTSCLAVAERIIKNEEVLNGQKNELENLAERLSYSNQNMELASRRFEELFNGLPVSCFTVDRNGVIFEWNRASEELFQKPQYEIFMRTAWDSFELGSHDLWNSERLKMVFEGQPIHEESWTYIRDDGSEVELLTSLFPLIGAGTENNAAISVNIDVTERNRNQRLIQEYAEALKIEKQNLIEANEKLETLAITDGLTGLWNHRHFRELLDKIVKKAQMVTSMFSVIMLDVDHFKTYNDTYGHPEGDEVLKTVAKIILLETREGVNAARYGGEEFVIILQRDNADIAMMVAERLRKSIEQYPWAKRQITASFGVASFNGRNDNHCDVIKQADLALYHSKEHGRNMVTHFNALSENTTTEAA